MDQMIGRMLDNRYELLELIGSGGMAVVYKAMCHRLNRYVAVKIMRPELAKNEKFRRRFQTESQAIAKLSHPNIVGVYDVSRTDHVEYIVMELVDGVTLKQYLQEHGPLDAAQAVDFSLQIARALSHAHGKGIVHRDIKPQNILVVENGVIKVADFGIANLQSEVPDVENEAIGSVHYISPEQARGLPVDGRSDIYSLGIVMYEMLSGKLPFDGDDDRTVALKHLSAVPAPLREIAPSVPEALEKIVMKAMNASLDERYQTVDALVADLETMQKTLNGSLDRIEGNVAPLSTAGELGREDYIRRRRRAHRVSMLSGFFGVMAAILIIAVFLWNYFLSDIFVVNQRVAIPNFVGSNYETIINSKEFKDKYNFDLIYEIDPNVERGIIIGQSPDAGKSYMLTSDGINVTLTVSTGVMLTEIPNLLNYDYREATSELEKLGFVVDKTFADSDDVAADCVMQISPSPGEKLPAGATVYLTISQGTKTETVITETDDGHGNIVETESTVTQTYLYITVSHKTADEMAAQYGFNEEQKEYLAELLVDENNSLWSQVLYGIMGTDDQIVTVALSQIGNMGGEPYWSWYGFNSRVEWCACFVSWCANECGYIDAGVIPKYAGCVNGVQWFKDRGQWLDNSAEPAPGMIIFFDWTDESGQDGLSDHTGIVQKVENGRVYTVEGNSGDSVRQKSYPVGYYEILGYGIPQY